MSTSPPDDDHTDELPILLETVVLEDQDPRLPQQDLLEDTNEHTAAFIHLAAEDDEKIEALKSDLAARAAKIETLEEDVAKLAQRWADVEEHLTAKDSRIAALEAETHQLEAALTAAEESVRRATGTVTERNTELERLRAELDETQRQLAAKSADIEQLKASVAAAEKTARELEARIATPPTPNVDELQRAREELASLTSYIANRRAWWDALEAKEAQSTRRIAELEKEVAAAVAARQNAEKLATQESERAKRFRTELIEHARATEALRGELDRPQIVRSDQADIARLSGELDAARAALATAHTETETLRAKVATLAEQPPAARPGESGDELSHLAATTGGPADAAATAPPAPVFEVIAQLEAEVEHKRQQVTAQLVELRDRDQRLAAAEKELERLKQELRAARTQTDRHDDDLARLERALVEKDRALEARDARINTLQEELNQRLGALQRLNAMDLSLQGLDSKMSERLRADNAPTDHGNTPALVCLTGDAPRQFALTKSIVMIGRGADCDIQILTQFVSREHARVAVTHNRVVIEDLGSTNGVFVNSLRVDRQELRHGDLITVGETQFRFLESMAH